MTFNASAPAIWKETHSPTQVDSALYFLHRDYLGSIVPISDIGSKTGDTPAMSICFPSV